MLGAQFEVFDAEDAMTSAVLSRFDSGAEPHARTFQLNGVGDPAGLVPLAEAERSARLHERHWLLVRMDGCTVLVQRSADGSTVVHITGPTAEAVMKAEAAVRANAPVADDADDEAVEVDFWCNMGRDLHNETRRIDAPRWGDVARNYPAPVAAAVADVLDVREPVGRGRLLLWHGPPGTGKTTAARVLARAWAPWCRTLFVVDPDELFGNGAYLVRLLMASGRADEDDGQTWRLLVIEDADELLRADAKRAAGQAMARLLNLADGFLGQGVNLLILLSTNEPVGRLHPAVTRPGRCLAEIEFRPFTRGEAAVWLGRPPASAAAELTLADVFHDRGDVARIGDRTAADRSGHPGLYL